MSKQQAFFLSPWEIYQRDHPKLPSKRRSTSSKPKVEKIYDCSTCGLSEKCKHPKIKMFGEGRKKILFVGLCPGRTEDKEGIPFVGASGDFLDKKTNLFGINLDIDCKRTNIIQCYPGMKEDGSDKDPTETQIKACRVNLLKDIQEAQPQLIICLGTHAVQAILQTKTFSPFIVSEVHGMVFPYHQLNCWVGCSYHPSFFVRQYRNKDGKNDDMVFVNDMVNILSALDVPLPKPLTTEGNKLITNVDEAVEILEKFSNTDKPAAFDYEANNTSCYIENPEIATVSLSNDVKEAFCIPFGWKDVVTNEHLFSEKDRSRILEALRKFLSSNPPKVVQNYNMEELWSRNVVGQSMNNFIWDTMVTAHVLNCATGTTGLGFQVFALTGHEYKGVVDVKNIFNNRLEDVAERNCFDSRYTLMSYYDQKNRLKGKLKEFNDFYTKGIPVLANLKDRGVPIDVKVLEEFEKEYSIEQTKIVETISKCSKVKQFGQDVGEKFNPDSPKQLSKVLFEYYGEKKRRMSSEKNPSTDEKVLHTIQKETKNEEVRTIASSVLKFRKCSSILERVSNYRNLLDSNNYVHPTYNLNVVVTYRSSANDPNIQNVFKHDEELLKFRRSIVPRPGNILLEVDYSGIEVRLIAMHSQDKNLINQIKEDQIWRKEHPENTKNPFETHRRWAAKLYQTSWEEVTKDQRYNTKNGFNFPSFYLSMPESIAEYESFRGVIPVEHIRKVQEDFWKEYPDVKEWQKDMIKFYNKYGYIEGFTGWRRYGPLKLTHIANNIIQGDAFHVSLDALERIDAWMIKKKMWSKVFIEVHDSIDTDTFPQEKEEVIQLQTEIMCSERFDWQRGVPLEVEWEESLTNWYDLVPLKI